LLGGPPCFSSPPTGALSLLKHSDVVRYMIERGLLSRHIVVDGTVTVRDASSRNRIFVVDGGGTCSFVLKQGMSAEGIAAVAHEAAVYESLRQRGDRIADYLPPVCDYDTSAGVLILGKESGDRDLRTHQLRTGRFSRALASSVGDAMATLHRETACDAAVHAKHGAPWVLSVHEPSLSIFRDASSAVLDLIRIVQSTPEFGDQLDTLRRGWQPSCLIHYDMKWDNLIAYRIDSRPAGRFLLRIIDWEAAQFGDPRWDLGSVLSHYLSTWLFSIPITGRQAAERFPELARFPLTRMQPAMAACWLAYRKRVELDHQIDTQWLSAAVGYCAARLLQTAYEAAQSALHLDSNMALHLQVAANILSRPLEAAVHLLGIPMEPQR